jgi:hypothetical protein
MLDLAHMALPGDRRLVVGSAQFLRRRDGNRAHEVLRIEPVGARARALRPVQPDLFFGDASELGNGRGRAVGGGCAGKVLLPSIIGRLFSLG